MSLHKGLSNQWNGTSKIGEAVLGTPQRRANLILLPLIGIWTFFRVNPNNPVILGDEYLYSLNSRHGTFWGPQIAGDFSNYLFNSVYSVTNVCGPAFYSCVKGLNVIFFLAFLLTIFFIVERYLKGWALSFFISLVALSPISAYTSLFLPEMFYFLGLSIVALFVVRALESRGSWVSWVLVGVALGITSLVKPHAWLSLLAILLVVSIQALSFHSKIFFGLIGNTFAFLAGAAAARTVLGFVIAGPQAISFFGSYVTLDTAAQLTSAPSYEASNGSIAGSGPLNGLIQLFPAQLQTHLLVVISLSALSTVFLLVAIWNVVREKSLRGPDGFALFVLIWCITLILEVVAFTGWITGGGDDHTSRVLMRYYDFVLVFLPVGAFAVFSSKGASRFHVAFRWTLAVVFVSAITVAYSGYFATLTIQIADAPALAGLVTNENVWTAASVLSVLGVMVFATFPQFSRQALLATLIVTFAMTGWQIQEQFSGFRASESRADIAGKLVANELGSGSWTSVQIFGTSRFEVTNAAFWIDKPDTTYEIVPDSVQVPESSLTSEAEWILVFGQITLPHGSDYQLVLTGEEFRVFSR